MSFFENILLVIVALAGACAALWVAYGMVKALRYLIEWYDDRQYKHQQEFIKGQFNRYNAAALLEQFRKNHGNK